MKLSVRQTKPDENPSLSQGGIKRKDKKGCSSTQVFWYKCVCTCPPHYCARKGNILASFITDIYQDNQTPKEITALLAAQLEQGKWEVSSSYHIGSIQHSHPSCYPAICMFNCLGSQEMTDVFIHHHVLPLPAMRD